MAGHTFEEVCSGPLATYLLHLNDFFDFTPGLLFNAENVAGTSETVLGAICRGMPCASMVGLHTRSAGLYSWCVDFALDDAFSGLPACLRQMQLCADTHTHHHQSAASRRSLYGAGL